MAEPINSPLGDFVVTKPSRIPCFYSSLGVGLSSFVALAAFGAVKGMLYNRYEIKVALYKSINWGFVGLLGGFILNWPYCKAKFNETQRQKEALNKWMQQKYQTERYIKQNTPNSDKKPPSNSGS